MNKYVVVSTNNNPDYYVYAPYMEKAWNKLGWNLCVMITHDVDSRDLNLVNLDSIVIKLPEIPELRDATIAQAGRLYAANYLSLDSLIMTSDMDLLPLTDYWQPSSEGITIFGHDLTDYTYYPMGYVAMRGHNWMNAMSLTYNTHQDMLRDAKEFPICFSNAWEEWWNYDWTLLTKRLKPRESQITFVKRGRGHSGYAYGRVDRGDGCQIPPGETLIDAHLENHNSRHPEKFSKFISLFESIYGKL